LIFKIATATLLVIGVAYALPIGVTFLNHSTLETHSQASPISNIEQTSQGSKPAAALIASFDAIGYGFEGPQG
jgi:K+-transporting ATPase c subunit